MNSIKKICLFPIWIMTLMFILSCSDKVENFSDLPGLEKTSWSSTVVCHPDGETLQYTFTALADWSIRKDGDWFTISSQSGKKGQSKLTISVEKNQTGLLRSSKITFYVQGYKSVSFILEQDKQSKTSTDDTDMNSVIDNYLKDRYLWNDDYKAMSRNLSIPYVDTYDNYLENTLQQMTTNTLDKKPYIYDYDMNGNPIYEYSLYSYIDRVPKNTVRNVSYAGVNHNVQKDAPSDSYGINKIDIVSLVDESGSLTGNYAFIISAIYPNSPASSLGINRGHFIYKVNGKSINQSNYQNFYFELLLANQGNIKILVGNGQEKPEEKTLMAMEIDKTPILKSLVIEDNGRKIGYLCYNSFDAAYDDDLLEVIADLKSKEITDFVLDLRYNGGGHLISSMMLSACIAGDKCDNQKFVYSRYNQERMANIKKTEKETQEKYDGSTGYFYTEFFYPTYYGVDLKSHSLNLNHLYVLTTSSTASSSELLINSLRGIDFPVTIIGENTNGKNVGMEVKRFDLGNYTYELAPITFQYYNAKSETIPTDGMKVDHDVDEWDNGFIDFGDKDEPMLAKALELITGVKTTSYKASRNASSKVQRLDLPIQKRSRLEGTMVIRPEIKMEDMP